MTEIAQFYSGLAQATFNVDIQKDLEVCMIQDPLLTQTVELALTGLANQDEAEWEKNFTLATVMSKYDMEPCNENEELNEIAN